MSCCTRLCTSATVSSVVSPRALRSAASCSYCTLAYASKYCLRCLGFPTKARRRHSSAARIPNFEIHRIVAPPCASVATICASHLRSGLLTRVRARAIVERPIETTASRARVRSPTTRRSIFSGAAATDIGVGSNAGGEFDAPVNESPLHTSGIELNDGSSESADFRLVDRPLDRGRLRLRRVEFLFDCLVDLDDEALPCVRARRASCRQSVEVSIARVVVVVVVASRASGERAVGRSFPFIHPSIARPSTRVSSRARDRDRANARARRFREMFSRAHLVRRVVERRHVDEGVRRGVTFKSPFGAESRGARS